ncbi:hypothetical protein M0R45_010854 [Rubus argutus]|uniref:Uncharacterized protein n=1 Tax=Rubus argutus TaxID=59490 RepID=A0AAW1Y8J5_RUBAR
MAKKPVKYSVWMLSLTRLLRGIQQQLLDPVTGSAHCGLAPYWCKKLGKCDVVAYQASPRGGMLNIHLDKQNQRVLLRGEAVYCDGRNCSSLINLVVDFFIMQ